MILRGILAFIAAVVVTDVALAWVNTTFVIAELQALGIEVPFGKRVSTMMQDAVGIAPNILPALVFGFAVAFAVAWAVVRWVLPGRGAFGYPLAGVTCLLVVDLALGQIFNTHPIAATRTVPGLLAVLATGALGGWVFFLLSRSRGDDGSLQRSAT